MIIAITSKGKGLNSVADPHFGRAEGFTIYNTETGEIEFISNLSNKNASQGAGTQSAAIMAHHKVEAVVSGSFGPKAEQSLSTQNIKMWVFKDELTIQDIIEQIKSGKIGNIN
jgi:predicted Fe-Mo cluster-binding NifX family protein